MKNKFILILLCISQLSFVKAQTRLWQPISEAAVRMGGERLIIPQKYKTFRTAITDLRNLLNAAPDENNTEVKNSSALIELPMPDGSVQRFKVVSSHYLAPELAAKFPEIRTFNVMGIDHPGTYGKLDITALGFHGMLYGTAGNIFIDPYKRNNVEDYITYYADDFIKDIKTKCQTEDIPLEQKVPQVTNAAICSGANLRTYRLAVACTGEYAIAVAGANPTLVNVLSAVTTTVLRVSGIYEKEVSIKFTLIGAESSLLFLDPATDPFTGNNDASVLINESQQVIDNVALDANYDIGHTFSTGGGGLAGLGVVCTATQKGRGITGSSNPVGDPYDVDFVCHEFGHQFGCNHSYNQCTGNATEHAGTMVEPGSGITIMGYANVCDPKDNLASQSIPYFHSISFDELMTYSNTGAGNSCGTTTSTGNTAPVVGAITTYTIPKLTPFDLIGKATDADNDPLTYSWEETDNNSTPHDLGTAAPYFKSDPPRTDSNRIFIPMANVLLGQTSIKGEYLPSTPQTLNFRLTARDNKGGVCYGTSTLVIANAGSFKVTSQNTTVTWNACKSEKITWDIAGTDQAPINTAKVDIFFTKDGGTTLIPVISGVPNTGSCNITVPTVTTTTGRIIIKGVNNVFFAVNAADITVVGLCADFEASKGGVKKTDIELGQSLDFKDLSSGNPTTWSWTFEGGTPATSTIQHPTITYNSPGTYNVELKIGDGTVTNTVVKKYYITVGATYNKGQAYTCIAIDTARNVWAGTNKAGVFFLNKKTTPGATQFSVLPYSGTFDPTKFLVQSIACDSLGNAWVGHGGAGNTTGSSGGMERIDYNNPATIQHYTPTSQTQCLKLGVNDGLATRNIQCVVVDRKNTVWSAHKYHDLTTSPNYYVTPGSFSFKSPGAAIFTTRSTWDDRVNGLEPAELPYPAYTCNPPANKSPQTRTCNSIACGKDEVWVSVYPYEALNGAVFPARILRYNLSGAYIGPSIDFKTIGVPTPGGVFNGIFINKKGDAWVTVGAKGFGVKTNGVWSFITPADMPCVFPSGASINQNAIWGNKFGHVFIGTNKGLIVYNGEGSVKSASSYSFYAFKKDNGANRSITGGVSENDSIQWIASDDGIVRAVIGRFDMTKNDIDYTSCNNADMNDVEAAIKTGEGDLSYHDYPVETIICDKKTTKYPDRCNAEWVYGMLKSRSELSSPTPADYPKTIQELFVNEHKIPFTLATYPPLYSAISLLTDAGQTTEQANFNNPQAVSCTKYRLYGNTESVIMHFLYDQGPTHRYFKECNWLWFTAPNVIAFDFVNSMDDYCGDKLENIQYDPIWKFVDDKRKTITNYTAKGHVLYPGKVETIVVEECGVVKTVVRGVGLQYCGNNCRGAVMGTANKVLGKHLFINVNKRVQEEFEK